MNILVTGSKGFVASHLIPKLKESGHKVVGMDIKETHFQDVRDYACCLARIGNDLPDYVVHLASLIDVQESINAPQSYTDTNITGIVNMLTASKNLGVKRFVFASSAAAENPTSPYGVTKLCGEQWCDVFQKCYGLSTVSLRFFNVYGTGTEKGVIPIFMDKIRKGESPVINGDGEQTRDFVYVNDVVDAIIKAMNSDVNGVYEVGTGMGCTILELCDILLTEMKANLKIKFVKGLDGEIKESICTRKIATMQDLKWKPQYMLVEKGIREMLH
jgi:nucleoside-diphosphate-sugar epimerase